MDGPGRRVAHGPYVDAVVAALENAGIGVDRYDVERSPVDPMRVATIVVARSSAGVFAADHALMLFWDDQLGWRLAIYYANGKGAYTWLLPVPLVAAPDQVVAALLAARSGARLPEVPDGAPPARDPVAAARFEGALAAYGTDPAPGVPDA